jgi:dihydrofolate reductase
MTNYVYCATSLDGYIATLDGGIEWLSEIPNPNQSDFGYSEFILKIDAIIMGRNTFEKVLSFGEWPYTKPVFVLSNNLKEIPEQVENVQLINGDIKDIIQNLINQGYQNLYVDGGKTITNFLKEDLIDEMIITILPIVLGSGIPLFNKFDHRLDFVHKSTDSFSNGIVQSWYIRKRD